MRATAFPASHPQPASFLARVVSWLTPYPTFGLGQAGGLSGLGSTQAQHLNAAQYVANELQAHLGRIAAHLARPGGASQQDLVVDVEQLGILWALLQREIEHTANAEMLRQEMALRPRVYAARRELYAALGLRS